MVASNKPVSSPLTFDLGPDLQAKLEAYQSVLGRRSTSSIIRFAIKHFPFERFCNEEQPRKQISVRLPLELKEKLIHYSELKSVSVGELLRAALGSLPEKPNQDLINQILNTTMATKKNKTKAVKKSVAKKKAAPKKKVAAKKAVKKAAPKKKAAAKKAAKKAAPKKKAAKKAAKKAVKKAAKKAAPKKAAPKKKAAKKKAAKKAKK